MKVAVWVGGSIIGADPIRPPEGAMPWATTAGNPARTAKTSMVSMMAKTDSLDMRLIVGLLLRPQHLAPILVCWRMLLREMPATGVKAAVAFVYYSTNPGGIQSIGAHSVPALLK